MGDIELTCEGCGARFVWTEKEQTEAEENGEGGLIETEAHCKRCRPKQDQQRG
jgi:hypothetical protein